MNNDEILATLKSEMLLAHARSLGAKEAYWNCLREHNRSMIYEKGIVLGAIVVAKFSDGQLLFQYEGISHDGEDVLGRYMFKSLKTARYLSQICKVSHLPPMSVTTIEKLKQAAALKRKAAAALKKKPPVKVAPVIKSLDEQRKPVGLTNEQCFIKDTPEEIAAIEAWFKEP